MIRSVLVRFLDAMAARDMHFVVASGNSMSPSKPMFAETLTACIL